MLSSSFDTALRCASLAVARASRRPAARPQPTRAAPVHRPPSRHRATLAWPASAPKGALAADRRPSSPQRHGSTHQHYLCLAGTGARRAVAVTRSCADPRAACARRRVRASLALASSPTLDRQAALPRQETRPPGRGAAITAAITAPAEFSPQRGGTTRARLRLGSRVVPFATAITVSCAAFFVRTHVSVVA